MGRSKEFDEDVVLRKAMELFWERGYEQTSMSDLVKHMGIHRRSLYDTFGDKHALYLQAFDCYRKYSTSKLKSDISQAKTAKQAIQCIFDFIIEGNADKHWGCFFVNAATEMVPRDKNIEEKTEEAFIKEELFLAEIIYKGQQSGEFSDVHKAEDLAGLLQSALVGIRVLARTSASKEKMHRIGDFFLKLVCE